MDYANLGATGLKVSRICLGTLGFGSRKWRAWVLEEPDARPLLRRALELGITYIDTADMYSVGQSEEILGRALKDFGPARERLVIATKVFNPMGDDPNERGLSRKHIFHAIDASLRRLQLDYVDLYQIHRFDPQTPIEETLCALDDLVRMGKVLHIGASSMFAWQFSKMLHLSRERGWARFATMQNHYNLIYREEEREMMPLCRDEGVGVIPWSPLARGALAGNRQSGTERAQVDKYARELYGTSLADSDQRVVDAVRQVASARGVPPARVALAWLLHKPGIVAPILGVTKPHQLEDAVASVSLKLEPSEIAVLEAPYTPHPVAGHE